MNKNKDIGSVANCTFNLNSKIKVKLLEKGYQRLADLYNKRFYNMQKIDTEYYKKKADKDGYSSFQAWQFMAYFGELTSIGANKYYETEIIIASKDITPCI